MTDESKEGDLMWRARVGVVCAWTFGMAVLTIAFILGLLTMPVDPTLEPRDQNLQIGCASVMVAGCASTVWSFGLLLVAVFFAALRR